jgi:hypothetical protein
VGGIQILQVYCLILSRPRNPVGIQESSGYPLIKSDMRDRTKSAPELESRAEQKRSELAHKIASLIGSKEKWVTDVPGLILVRRTKVIAPGCGIYEPSIAVIAQGRHTGARWCA